MSKPAHKIRNGVLQVTIWRNSGDKGSWYSVIPSRSYKQGDDSWKETDSLNFDDLLRDGQAVRPGPHLDHAPAAGRPEGQEGRRSGRLNHHLNRAGCRPAHTWKGTRSCNTHTQHHVHSVNLTAYLRHR